LDARLLLPGLLLANVPLVLVLAVVHDPADGGLGQRSDLHEIEVQVSSPAERVVDRHDADLRPVRSHEPNLRSPDPIVHARFNRDLAPPPWGETKSAKLGWRSKTNPRA